jgi:putative ABC transport system ATP-binding protein
LPNFRLFDAVEIFLMNIEMSDLLPSFFPESRKSSSEIWGKELVFRKGEYIKIVAPSGKGKTSFIHFIYGLRSDYNGLIAYDRGDIRSFSPEDFSERRRQSISIVLQDLRLLPEQTVRQNIEIKRQLNPYHPAKKIVEMCERLGIGDKLESKCRNCSYGEQQRVAIIRALMQPYDLLLLDEPFSHLDELNSQNAMRLMDEESKQREAGIIFADLERIDYFPQTILFHL